MYVHVCVSSVSVCRVADKAWIMLKSYLETYDPSSNYQLQKCVTKKLLSLDFTLPHWLVQKYKVPLCIYICKCVRVCVCVCVRVRVRVRVRVYMCVCIFSKMLNKTSCTSTKARF